MNRLALFVAVLAVSACAAVPPGNTSRVENAPEHSGQAAAPLSASVSEQTRQIAVESLGSFTFPGNPVGQIAADAPLGTSFLRLDTLANSASNDEVRPFLNISTGSFTFLVTYPSGQQPGTFTVSQSSNGTLQASSLSGGFGATAFALRTKDMATRALQANAYFYVTVPALNREFLACINTKGQVAATPLNVWPGDVYQIGTWLDADTLLTSLRSEAKAYVEANGDGGGLGG